MLAERPEYLASVSLETRNLPDVYPFYVNGNKLFSPVTDLPVKNSMTTNTEIDKEEYQAFLAIENWAVAHEEGLCFWVSPPHRERSPQGKIIVSELGNSVLQNRAILFDTTEEEAVILATKLSSIFSDPHTYSSACETRMLPIFSKYGWDYKEWAGVLESIISQSNQWEMVKSGEDLVEAERTLDLIRIGDTVPMGNNPTSCPPGSPLGVFGRGAVEGKMVRNCGKCGVTINKVIFKGYRCGNCGGEYLGC
jgi:hypothetical protein